MVYYSVMANRKAVGIVGTGRAGSGLLERSAYCELKSYQTADIVNDATEDFCSRYISPTSVAYSRMVDAARQGKYGIIDGSEAAAVSKTVELKLTGAARCHLEGLLVDCEEFLKEHELPLWEKNSPDALKIRVLAYEPDRSYACYRSHIRRSPESGANTLICLVNQATYLLRRQMDSLERLMFQQCGGSVGPYSARRRRGL